MAIRYRSPRALLFTQQTVGLGARKTSMIFLAEALERAGFRVGVVTVQLSWLSRFGRNNRLAAIPRRRRNHWYEAGELSGFVWVPPVHPLRTGIGWIDRLSGRLVGRFGALLPRTLRRAARGADLIVIESCSAVALFRTLRRTARDARIIYSMSDRLDVVGMHPALSAILRRDGPAYDLIRVPAAAMLGDVPGARMAHIPQGLDKRVFDRPSRRPFGPGRHAVSAGDMMLDRDLLIQLADARPDVTFHHFGRQRIALPGDELPANLVHHAEVPFDVLAPFLIHADVGLALYMPRDGLDYLAQSSLKNLQYAYCGLRIVAPHFVADGLARGEGYDPARPESAIAALDAALSVPKAPPAPEERDRIRDWDAVAAELLRAAAVPSPSASRIA